MNLNPFTAFTTTEGFWKKDRRIVPPQGHVAAVCEGCGWFSLHPKRESEAELLRVTHMKSAHHDELLAGTATMHLAPYLSADGSLTFPEWVA